MSASIFRRRFRSASRGAIATAASPGGPGCAPGKRDMPEPADRAPEATATVASLRMRAEQELSDHQRRIERWTAWLGQPRTVYLVILSVAAWTTGNLVAPEIGWPAVDPPPFEWLQLLVGLGALLMGTVILVTQNRQTRHAEQRAQLDLQVNLLAEQKAAKLVALLEELRRDIPAVPDRVDIVAEAMVEPIDPHAVMTALEGRKEPRR